MAKDNKDKKMVKDNVIIFATAGQAAELALQGYKEDKGAKVAATLPDGQRVPFTDRELEAVEAAAEAAEIQKAADAEAAEKAAAAVEKVEKLTEPESEKPAKEAAAGKKK